jgi:hypothetical protein
MVNFIDMSKKFKKIDILTRYVDSIDILYLFVINVFIFQMFKSFSNPLHQLRHNLCRTPIRRYAGFGKSPQFVDQLPWGYQFADYRGN